MLTFLQTLTAEHVEKVLQKLTDLGITAGKNIVLAIVVYVAGRFLIKLINRLMLRTFTRRKVELSVQTFLKSFVNILLTIVLVVSVISVLGINTTSIAALLASAGVAVGMALSGNLQNLAGGLIILVFKPYRVGDYIEAQGTQGTVREIQIFHTILSTVDNKIIYVPNGSLSSNAIVNYSKQETRRAEWVFGVEYGEDFERVKAVLERIIAADERILQTPAPFIGLGSLSASSVDVKVRVWTKSSDYWDVVFDMNRVVYETFNKEGIGFPFPQLTVHQAND